MAKNVVVQLDKDELSADFLKDMYRSMWLIRDMDRKAVALQRQGRIGTYAPLEGQEAAQIGSAMALRKQDFVFPSYREHGVAYVHGVPISTVLLYWNGRYEGCVFPESVNFFANTVPIATQIPHAVGAALAAKLQNLDQVTIVYFGDGSTSEGDFHEAMNFAAVFQTPVVFFCQNNGYAISVPYHRQTKVERIAEKAKAYGMEGHTVDGNDAIAVYEAVKSAVDKAAAGGGPTLIEALTYRMGSHTTADDASRYRDSEEVESWRKKDPLLRMENELKARGLWSESWANQMQRAASDEVDAAIATMLAFPRVSLNALFDHVYETITPELEKQKQDAIRLRQLQLERGDRNV